jgi:predicted dehydrogenase
MAGGAVGTGLDVARSAHAYGSETIRLGLIGCGHRGTSAAVQALRAGNGQVDIIALADVFADRLQSAYRAVKGCQTGRTAVPRERQFLGLDAFSGVMSCPVDLVILATPPAFRPTHFAAAVAAGKHVFAEAPVAIDVPGVHRFLAANEEAKRRDLVVAVSLPRRHDRMYQQVIARLHEGAIGDIRLMRAYGNGTAKTLAEPQLGQASREYQLRNWHHFPTLSGHHIVEQHVHNLDVMNWLQRAHPVSARGMGGRITRSVGTCAELQEQYFVEYTYPDGAKLMSQCRRCSSCWNNVSEHAHGTRGRADLSGGKIYDACGRLVWRSTAMRGGQEREQETLLTALRCGTRPADGGEAAALSTMTAILGRLAVESGRLLTWDEAWNSPETTCQ